MNAFRTKMGILFNKLEMRISGIFEKAMNPIKEKFNGIIGGSVMKKRLIAAVSFILFVTLLVSCTMTLPDFAANGYKSTQSEDVSRISSEDTPSEIPQSSTTNVSSEQITTTTTSTAVPAAEKIGASKSNYSVYQGKSITINVIYTPSNAKKENLIWSSSNESIAKVSSSGSVQGVSIGNCTVTARSSENEQLAFTVNLSVIKEPVSQYQYKLVVYKGSQSVVAYTKDKNGDYTVQAKVMMCSTGTSGNETPERSFKILRKFRWKELIGPSWEQYCSAISSDYLFHSIPYNKKNDPSSMSTGGYNALGRKASHGCIRLACIDAKWIYDNVAIGSTVEITRKSGPKGKKVPLKSGSVYSGWDPTDPNPNSPYNKPQPKTTTTKKQTTTTKKPVTTTTTRKPSTTTTQEPVTTTTERQVTTTPITDSE